MITNLLTERAKAVLYDIPKSKKVSSRSILVALNKAEGMGKYLLDSIPNIKLPKANKIDPEELIKEAYYQSLKFEHPYVGTEHLLLSLLKLISSKELNRIRLELIKVNVFPNIIKTFDREKKTPILSTYGKNLNQQVIKSIDRPLVFKREYDALVSVLLLKNSSSVLLIGDKGVGKADLVDLLARNLTTLDVPSVLAGYQVVEFDLMAFMTSILNKGGIDLGLTALSEELKSVGRVILSLKNFQNVFFATAAGMTMPMFYSMFKSAIEAVNVKVIASLNTPLYEKIVAENEHVLREFSVVEVEEPDKDDALKVLMGNAIYLTEFHNVEIPDKVVKYVYQKAKELPGDVKFPKRGIDLLDHVCSFLTNKKSKIPSGYKKLVDKSFSLVSDIDDNVEKRDYENALNTRKKLVELESKLLSKEHQIFVGKALKLGLKDVDAALETYEEELAKSTKSLEKVNFIKLSGLTQRVKNRIIGQDIAVDLVVKSLIRSKLGLRSKKRPLGNFLFLGPTGIGKTETAKVLADEFFGANSLIRLDMSDFAEKHTVARLVGAPPGYVGYGEGGELTTKIEGKPDSVVLFDEIEKAHPDVLNILLQIMEEGELRDARGSTFDFSKCVVILTSNLGTDILHTKGIGFKDLQWTNKKVEKRLLDNAKKILKPELLNRFDELIVFNHLSKEDQFRVLNLLIKEIMATIKKQNIRLSVTKKVKDYLIEKGYSKEFGARELRRVVERELLDRIAEYLLKVKKRPKNLSADVKKNSIVVKNGFSKNGGKAVEKPKRGRPPKKRRGRPRKVK